MDCENSTNVQEQMINNQTDTIIRSFKEELELLRNELKMRDESIVISFSSKQLKSTKKKVPFPSKVLAVKCPQNSKQLKSTKVGNCNFMQI